MKEMVRAIVNCDRLFIGETRGYTFFSSLETLLHY